MRLPTRRKRGVPSRDSTSRSWWLSADCDRFRERPAFVRPPTAATVLTSCRCRTSRSIVPLGYAARPAGNRCRKHVQGPVQLKLCSDHWGGSERPHTPVATAARKNPLYEEVASEFRRKIDLGVLRVGEKLPSVRTLRNGRQVSTATVMEAYLRLERDGYVRVRDRSGFYVVQPPHHAAPQPSTGRAVAPPLPVGISALVAEVLLQA